MDDGAPVPEEHPDEVIQTVHDVRTTLDIIKKSLTSIESYGKRTRQVTVALVMSLALDIALTILVTLLSIGANSQAAEIKAGQYNTCLASNGARSDQIRLWNYFVVILESHPDPSQTTQQKSIEQAEVRQLLGFVNTTFSPIDCSSLR